MKITVSWAAGVIATHLKAIQDRIEELEEVQASVEHYSLVVEFNEADRYQVEKHLEATIGEWAITHRYISTTTEVVAYLTPDSEPATALFTLP